MRRNSTLSGVRETAVNLREYANFYLPWGIA
ncbi:hypothetical protein T01_10701 [Trichinella spiralis]|uniref:Uncharacterized protein n=1 Tax=Trichinella spiralis TaxID=6334 RepID=A0A0V1ACH0_TRISP|nr:hypothetical protein T01_10701 [Trichinella spiralis]